MKLNIKNIEEEKLSYITQFTMMMVTVQDKV